MQLWMAPMNQFNLPILASRLQSSKTGGKYQTYWYRDVHPCNKCRKDRTLAFWTSLQSILVSFVTFGYGSREFPTRCHHPPRIILLMLNWGQLFFIVPVSPLVFQLSSDRSRLGAPIGHDRGRIYWHWLLSLQLYTKSTHILEADRS